MGLVALLVVLITTCPDIQLSFMLIFEIAVLGHETWSLPKVPDVAHIFPFYPRVLKLSLFSLYGQQFPRYGPIFNIAIFGH